MSFLPVAVLGYLLNGATTLIDKILLERALPHPAVYTFYIAILGSFTILLSPFGLILNSQIIFWGTVSGILGTLATMIYFESLKHGEASVVPAVIGALNPLFTLILGAIFLNQVLNSTQILAFFILLLGAWILTINYWFKVRFNRQLSLMALSGLLFAIAYLTLREGFLISNFISGLVVSRAAGGLLVLFFLISPTVRDQIFSSRLTKNHFANKTSLLLFGGQILGAAGGLLITYAVSLENPALVNSLFGVQYLVILAVALILYERHEHLLDERLSKKVLTQKIIAIFILSFGMYLLSK